MAPGIVIAGAGQAGLQAAAALREGKYEGPITLVGDEVGLPYGRPPLSKAFLRSGAEAATLHLRPQGFLDRNGISLRAGVSATAINRAGKRLLLGTGEAVPYEALVLAIGARNRLLPVPGAGLPGVFSLRSAADALALRGALGGLRRVVVVGGGFLGLEVASTAVGLGAAVTVIEATGRLMARAVSSSISDYFLRRHVDAGVTVLLNESVAAVNGPDRVTGVQLRTGDTLPADLVLVAIGVLPNVELAASAKLDTADGIIVDGAMRTADAAIYAIGDCALHPNQHGGGPIRLESVQNAVDQARCVAANILGRPTLYNAIPWFWSEQADAKLQIAGLRGDADGFETVGGGDAFSVYGSRAGRLVCVESVNRPADHARARKRFAAEQALLSSAARH